MSTTSDLETLLDSPGTGTAPDTAPAPVDPGATGGNDTSQAPPAATAKEPEPDHVPRAALMDERRKRQEIERKVAEMEQRLQAAQKPAEQPPDLYADPERYRAALQASVEQTAFETRLHVTEAVWADKHTDYAEKRDIFVEAAQRDPDLARKLVASANPAKFAYDTGKRIAFEREVGSDPEAYKQRLREELLKELGHDPARPAQSQKPASAPVPKSLATIPSANRAPNGQFASKGPTPLEDIIG